MTLLDLTNAASESWNRADRIALWSLIIGAVAIIVAIFTLRRGNKNSSVASMIPLNAEIRQMWDSYIDALEHADFKDATELEDAEAGIAAKLERLMNMLEITAAIEVEGTLSGVSRSLMRGYLQESLSTLLTDTDFSAALKNPSTYPFIRRFLKRSTFFKTVLPPNSYADPDVTWLQRARSFFRY